MFSSKSATVVILASFLLLTSDFHFSSPAAPDSPFRLPLKPGVTVVVTQGNNEGDHKAANGSEYAFDFAVGRQNFIITAAQAGTVIGVNDSSNIQCGDLDVEIAPSPKPTPLKHCWTYANFVLIANDDGKTAALYMHLLAYSSQAQMPKVTTGEHVNQGDPIGLAGTTGWSTGVHLHFQVESLPSSVAQQTHQPAGWWWTNSLPVTFSNPEVLAKRQNGIPKTNDVFTVSSSSPSGIVTPPTRTLDFTPFVGTWYAHAQAMVIKADGTATYSGRVFVWCSDDPRPPCDTDNGAIVGGLNTQITFTNIIGNMASGTITGGTGDRDIHNTLLPVGTAISVTLNANDTLQVSDGSLLCGPTAIQNNADPGCNSGA